MRSEARAKTGTCSKLQVTCAVKEVLIIVQGQSRYSRRAETRLNQNWCKIPVHIPHTSSDIKLTIRTLSTALQCDVRKVTGYPSSKYVVYATACVYGELYGKITDPKKF